jgi:predicted GNAT family acetyltransferase
MVISKRTAAGFVVATAAALAPTGLMAQLPPPTPPSINCRSEKDRIPTLMLKLYDIHREQYSKLLGMDDVKPIEVMNTDKTEIDAEITKAPEVQQTCKDFGVEEKKVKKITVKGDRVVNTYYFLDESSGVVASATTTRYAHTDPEKNKDSKLSRQFWTLHVPSEQKVVFGYRETKPAEKPQKSNAITVEYQPAKNVFSTKHVDIKAAVTKDLAMHPVSVVEQQTAVALPPAKVMAPGKN